MNRRSFLKSLALSPIVPSVLCAKGICRPKSGPPGPTTADNFDWLGELHSFIYRGFYFTDQEVFDSELKYMILHPFFAIQGNLTMFMMNEQFEDWQRRHYFLDEMIRQWKEKQVFTTEELRGF